MPWSTVEQTLKRDWEQGDHITIVAPTKHGKTHLALQLADLSRYVLVLATKRRDPLVTDLKQRGYLITQSTDQVLWGENEPITPRVVVWPQSPPKATAEQRAAILRREMSHVMNWAQETGGWTIIADETMYLSEYLRLERELNEIWYGGRTMGVSLVSLMQRPARVPRLAFSQAAYIFLGKYGDKRDVDTVREIGSIIPREVMESGIHSLSKPAHEFLFIDTVRDQVAITVAPER